MSLSSTLISRNFQFSLQFLEPLRGFPGLVCCPGPVGVAPQTMNTSQKKYPKRFEGVASVSDVSNYHIDYIIKLYLSQLNLRGHELFECSLLLGKCSEMPLIGETCIFFNSPWISCAFCFD